MVGWLLAVATAGAAAVIAVAPAATGGLLVAWGIGGGGLCTWFARRAGTAERRAWTLLGVAQLMNGAANVAIVLHPVGWFGHGEDVSAVVFTLATTVTGIGLAMLVLPARADWLSAAADGALVIGSVFVLAWSSGAAGRLAPVSPRCRCSPGYCRWSWTS